MRDNVVGWCTWLGHPSDSREVSSDHSLTCRNYITAVADASTPYIKSPSKGMHRLWICTATLCDAECLNIKA